MTLILTFIKVYFVINYLYSGLRPAALILPLPWLSLNLPKDQTYFGSNQIGAAALGKKFASAVLFSAITSTSDELGIINMETTRM